MFKFINKSVLYASAIILTIASGYFAFTTFSGNSISTLQVTPVSVSPVVPSISEKGVIEPAALTPAVNPVREIEHEDSDTKINKLFFPNKGTKPQVDYDDLPIEEYNGKPMIIVVRRMSDMKGVCETTE